MKKNVIVVIGPGQIGQAIARRVGVGRHVLLADMHDGNGVTARNRVCLLKSSCAA